MLKHVTFYILFICSFQGFLFLNRDDIIADYQPLLTERRNNYTTKYNLAVLETNLVITEIQNQTWSTVAFMDTEISTLRESIVSHINESTIANSTGIASCLKVQQTVANQLSSVAVNSTCWVGVSYPDLTTARDALAMLAEIPNSTIAACASLNPLPSQDELFLGCITHKILELDELIDVLIATFDVVKTESLNSCVQCLADQSSLIWQQISQINFQIMLCMS